MKHGYATSCCRVTTVALTCLLPENMSERAEVASVPQTFPSHAAPIRPSRTSRHLVTSPSTWRHDVAKKIRGDSDLCNTTMIQVIRCGDPPPRPYTLFSAVCVCVCV